MRIRTAIGLLFLLAFAMLLPGLIQEWALTAHTGNWINQHQPWLLPLSVAIILAFAGIGLLRLE